MLTNLNWIIFAFLYLSFDVGVKRDRFLVDNLWWIHSQNSFMACLVRWASDAGQNQCIGAQCGRLLQIPIIFKFSLGFLRRTLNTHFCVLIFFSNSQEAPWALTFLAKQRFVALLLRLNALVSSSVSSCTWVYYLQLIYIKSSVLSHKKYIRLKRMFQLTW